MPLDTGDSSFEKKSPRLLSARKAPDQLLFGVISALHLFVIDFFWHAFKFETYQRLQVAQSLNDAQSYEARAAFPAASRHPGPSKDPHSANFTKWSPLAVVAGPVQLCAAASMGHYRGTTVTPLALSGIWSTDIDR